MAERRSKRTPRPRPPPDATPPPALPPPSVKPPKKRVATVPTAPGTSATPSTAPSQSVKKRARTAPSVAVPAPAPAPATPAVPDDPSNLECGVCFDVVKLRGQLDGCNHYFCFECIAEWAKIENTCPHCKVDLAAPPAAAAPSSKGGKKRSTDANTVRVAKRDQRDAYEAARRQAAMESMTSGLSIPPGLLPELLMGLGYSPFSGFGGMLFSSLMMASPSFGPPPPRVNITRVPRAPSAPSAPRPPPPPASSGPNEVIVISDSEDEEGTPAAPSRSGPPGPLPAGPFVVDEDEEEEEEDYDEEDEEEDDDGEICHTYGCPYHDPYLRYSMPWGDDSSDDSDY